MRRNEVEPGAQHGRSADKAGSAPVISTIGHMEFSASPQTLVLSLVRGLWGEVHPQLRQASIEADEGTRVVRLRFEYDGSRISSLGELFLCCRGGHGGLPRILELG